MDNNEKKAAVSGFMWKLFERIGAQTITFIVSIFLARLIAPKYFGVISIVMIFISFLNVFVSAGFGSALIRKVDADIVDYSSITYFSLFLSIIFYIILFFMAPLISSLYKIEILTPLLRVMGLRLIFAAYNSIQQAYVAKHLLFKKFFYVTSIGTILSAFVGITMALKGYGAWAMVAQYLTNTVCDTILLTIFTKLRLKLVFSFKRVKSMLKFSLAILGGGLVDQLYEELRSIIIGFKYSPTDLAYYNKGKEFPNLINVNINGTISAVLYPVLSREQNNIQRVKKLTSDFIKFSSIVLIPAYIGIFVISENLIFALYGANWMFCVPYIKVLSLANIFNSINVANIQAFNAIGKSELTFKLNIIKKVSYTIIVLIAMNFGVMTIALASIPINLIAILINSYPSKKIFNYGFFEQLKDCLINIIPSILMALAVYFIGLVPLNIYLSLVMQVFGGIIIYLLLLLMLKNTTFLRLINIIKTFKNKE